MRETQGADGSREQTGVGDMRETQGVDGSKEQTGVGDSSVEGIEVLILSECFYWTSRKPQIIWKHCLYASRWFTDLLGLRYMMWSYWAWRSFQMSRMSSIYKLMKRKLMQIFDQCFQGRFCF